MLEQPECRAAGAARAMDCKGRPGPIPVKKLIQARLPFKRLNLTPKKGEDATDTPGAPASTVRTKGHHLEISLDNVENDCGVAPGVDLRPKLLNGEGPLGQRRGNWGQNVVATSTVIIDLTEDPSSHSPPCPQAAITGATSPGPEENGVGVREQQGLPEAIPKVKADLVSPKETLVDAPCDPEQVGIISQDGEALSCPDLPPAPGSPTECPTQAQDSWREAEGILFRGKVPMVVLQDILAVPAAPSRECESDLPESGPEEDSGLSHSSPSSSSPGSSPEGQPAPKKRRSRTSLSPSSTPADKVSKKLMREKNRLRLQRDKELLREERARLREEARQAKAEARRRKEQQKELKEKERREKREKDEKEKAEKQRLKEERRKERQEALEAKLEEKRKKEEEKRLREEEKRIKAEKAEITRFFQKPKTPQAPKTLAGSCGKFAPFEIKEHMALAPRCRATFNQDLSQRFDQLLREQNGDLSFLRELKGRRPLRSGPTRVSTGLFNRDVVIVGSSSADGVPERRKFGRMKLLQFCENHRPAYWGTWNKRTRVIRPRDPWARDWTLLDYEVDSDEEWEEEEPGESLSHSEGDDDDDLGEDEDEDDGFFVPHGYLSEDEGVTEECTDPENHKVRQKLKAKEWDEFLAKGKRFRVLQPVTIGCVWAAEADGCAGAELKVLQQFAACFLDTAPAEEEQTPKASKREKRDQQILAQLLPLLHGNVNGSKVIIREFQECCRRGLLGQDASGSPPSPTRPRPQTPTAAEDSAVPSKARLKRLISENSVYEKRPDFRMCWYVHPQVLRSFDREQLPVPCRWSYVTAVPSAPREDSGGVPPAPGPTQGTPVPLKRKSAGSMCITQFMKKRRHDGQVGAADMDGFQADTEEEEDDDGDCMIVEVPDAAGVPCGTTAGAGGAVGMDAAESALPAGLLSAS
ncbi:chromatin assembly factor 1 subunit A [Ochotona princeps]|uniref:chromatin assembly factor 1 subunit A n=1 Tax=Ochotona princeps TaxID=9978 RepID=UPI002714E402|nr:chromatin assembly factor 1 subunit A [Ochotona princeps]